MFDAREQGKLIMEDGKKPNKCIPKIPQRDITLNDMDRMIGLCDSNMMKLIDTILAKEVSIKSNKLLVGSRGKESHSRSGAEPASA